jgi:plasmid maintenance system antidote protein VapI
MFVRRTWTMTGFPGKLAGMTTQELVQDAPLAAYQAPTTYSEIIRDEVKAECGRRGISQRRLAQAMGLAQQSISERWRGRVPWTLDEVERLETALGLSRGALLFRCARRDSNPQPSDLSPLEDLVAVASGGCYECADELGCVDDACDCACHTRELVDVAAAWELAA